MQDTRATTTPKDEYSLCFNNLNDHPEKLSTRSTVHTKNLLGHFDDWIVETVRTEGEDHVFIRWINAEGGQRLVLPPAITLALARQRDSLTKRSRQRSSRRTAANMQAMGIHPAFAVMDKLKRARALVKAREARSKKSAKRRAMAAKRRAKLAKS